LQTSHLDEHWPREGIPLLLKRTRTAGNQAALDFEPPSPPPPSPDDATPPAATPGTRDVISTRTHQAFIAAIILLDLIAVGAALFSSALIRYPAGALLSVSESTRGVVLLSLGALSCVAFLSARGAYSPPILLTRRHQMATIFTAVVPAWALVQLLAFWLKMAVPFESRLVVALSLPLSLALLGASRLLLTRPMARWLYPRLARGSVWSVGAHPAAREWADDLAAQDSRERPHVARAAKFPGDAPSVGELDVAGVGEVVLVPNGESLDEVFDAAYSYLDALREVRIATPNLRGLASRIPLAHYDGVPVLRLRRPDLAGPEPIMKRWIDALGAAFGLLLLSPLLAVVAIWIKIDSPGPVLFRQARVGFRGRRFWMLKFRTMAHGNDPTPHEEYLREFIRTGSHAAVEVGGAKVFKLTNDARITRFGAWLRRYSIDELPQLWNVLRGEMSLVGPRPCTTYEWGLYQPWQRRRMDVAPGCTGLWQVRGRSEVTFEEMILLDLHYAHHWTPIGDLWLIAQTVPAMIRGRGGF
jgi:exopolysaccharide biosynthesis polyprenyl glycosylphosphotransferase